jgi:hypothetical protein
MPNALKNSDGRNGAVATNVQQKNSNLQVPMHPHAYSIARPVSMKDQRGKLLG